jgi:hypothetical protein
MRCRPPPNNISLSTSSSPTSAASCRHPTRPLPRLRNTGFRQPVIYYVGRPNPDAGVPADAFGVTNRPDQLLHLVIDALSRVRGRAAR